MSKHTNAAMCVYCGETIFYDPRKVTDMAAAHAKLFEHAQQCPKNPLVSRTAELENLLARQAKAAKQGMDAAKGAAHEMQQNASRMYAECGPTALESEREANAKLTNMVADLERERDALAALFVMLQDGATDLINAASEEEAGDAMELIAECSEKEARSILARRDAEQRKKALTETAKWFSALHASTELLSAEVVCDILMDQSRRQIEDTQ